jgi:PAS domain S-box-containing protein
VVPSPGCSTFPRDKCKPEGDVSLSEIQTGLVNPGDEAIARALRDSDDRLRSVISSASMVLWALDAQGTFTFSDGGALRLVGLSPGEVVGRSVFEVYADIPEVVEDNRRALAGEEFTTLRRIGTRTFEARYSVQRNARGEVVGVIGVAVDVTERQRAEAILQRRAEQAARFQEALMELARFRSEDLESALEKVVQVDSRTLGVERVSVWLFNEDGSELVCRTLHAGEDAGSAAVSSLRADELPDYFDALHQHRVIAAHDALRDRATHEFAESYLIPLGIASMLDVPIWRGGSMVGVVCHEHVGQQREWTVQEQDFAASIADMVSLALEAAERRRAEAALRTSEEVLRRSRDDLERLVTERTRDLAQTNWVLEAQVAERERAEAELRQKSSELEAVFQALPDLYLRLDSEGRFLDYKAGQRSGFYAAPEEFLGRSMQEVLPPYTARLIEAGIREVGRTGELMVVEYTLPNPDGERAFEARLLPFADGQIITVVRDITEQKAAERALKRSEEHFRRITENSSDVASIIDAHGIGVYHSPSIERVLGYPPEEILGTSSFERIHPDDQALCRDVLGEMMGNPGTTRTVEFRYHHRDGSWRTLEVRGRTLLPDSAAEGVIINARDVTERRAAEEALKRAKLEAERADRAKSEFLSRMSHELRTPMNSILGFAQLLARKPLAPDELRGVEHILKAGRHLLNLINEVLDIARIEANRQQLSLEPVRADVVVHEALTLIRPLAVQRGCRIEDGEPLPEIYVRGDRQRLTQVLLNLLSNAIKYNLPEGSAGVAWELSEGEGRSRLRIGVRDTGPGIAPEHLGRIFEPFERLGAERSGEEGTGLGLALSRRLVEAMGGCLTVESTPGEGSTFWVELVVETSPLERLSRLEGTGASAGSAPALPTAKILYIEDNLANLTLVETILASEPEIVLVPALQGQLGLELALEHEPDLILLDLHLPDIPGTEVLRRLQEYPRTRDIPVVVISADAMRGSVQRLMQSGARAYLTKPLEVDQFLDTVRRFLDERHAL